MSPKPADFGKKLRFPRGILYKKGTKKKLSANELVQSRKFCSKTIMLKEMRSRFVDGAQGEYKDIEDTEWVNEDGVQSSPRHGRRLASKRCLVLFSLLAILILFFTQHTGKYIGRGDLWTSTREIPNQVHFVRQVDKTASGDKLPLEFNFKHFMAIYSAHLWLKPERIFIWTDATKEDLASLKNSKNEYTRAIARLSTVNFGYREMPTVTSKGK